MIEALLAGVLLLPAANAEGAALLGGEEILLWPGPAPGSEGLGFEELLTERSQDPSRHDRIFTHILRPSLRMFRPEKPNGAAVIVMPGGAYQRVVVDKEGADICAWLNGLGVTAFVLKYRLPDEGHADGSKAPLRDGQRAVRLLRSRAATLGIDPRRIGVIGFSAGGHLAGALAGCSTTQLYTPRDEADRESARPDFVILGYPATGILAARPSEPGPLPQRHQLMSKYAVAGGVTKDSPPTFLFHASDDPTVSPEGSIRVYQALRPAGVPAEIHIFRSGGHGFGIRDAKGPVALWPTLCGEWLRALGLLDTQTASSVRAEPNAVR
jgi:acetyl esterase/lipase